MLWEMLFQIVKHVNKKQSDSMCDFLAGTFSVEKKNGQEQY